MSDVYSLAGINLLLNLVVMGICICRLDRLHHKGSGLVGLRYVVMLIASATLAASPFVWEFPGWTTITFVCSVIFMLVTDRRQPCKVQQCPHQKSTPPAEMA